MAGQQHESAMAVMTLGEHLEELRRRLIVCLVAVAAVFIVCWLRRGYVMAVLRGPHERVMRAFDLSTLLKYQSYLEPVWTQLTACFVVALIIAAPIIIYQTWAFVAPGLFPHERRKVFRLGTACVVCFFAGISFGYFVFEPVAFSYLLRLAGPGTEPVLMIGPYVKVFFLLTFALGIAFQTPVVIYHLIRWGVITVEGLRRSRKGVILGAFILGAVLTPPDPLTQIMMATTLIILYDLGALVAAPGRATFGAFLRFTGVVVLVAAGLALWFNFRNVAELTVLKGEASVGELVLARGESAGIRRGAACEAGPDAVTRLTFGSKEGKAAYLAGEGRLRVHAPDSLSLLGGECLVQSDGRGGPVQVHAPAATVLVEKASVELLAPRPDVLTVTVFTGEVTARAGEASKRITAGHTATFHSGGTPADVTEAVRRWEERLKPEDHHNDTTSTTTKEPEQRPTE